MIGSHRFTIPPSGYLATSNPYIDTALNAKCIVPITQTSQNITGMVNLNMYWFTQFYTSLNYDTMNIGFAVNANVDSSVTTITDYSDPVVGLAWWIITLIVFGSILFLIIVGGIVVTCQNRKDAREIA